MDVDDIRRERKKIGGIQNRVLIEAAIFRLVESRQKFGCQEKNLK